MATNRIALAPSARPVDVPSPMGTARGSVLAGLAIVAIGFGGFGSWAAVAPIASAAIAPGSIVVDSNRQTVQHLEGGIISEILVSDGVRVRAGDVLVRLDETRIRANVEQLRGQYFALRGEEARLEAERDALPVVTFPAELTSLISDPSVATIIKGQTNVFESRARTLKGQADVLQQRRQQIIEESKGLDVQQKAQLRQINLIAEEAKSVKELVDKGLEKRPRLLALERASAGLEGERGELLSNIARAEQRIGEIDLQLVDLDNRLMSEVVQRLREVQAQIFDVEQKLRATEDMMTRIDVRAPRSGQVVDLHFHTPGGVIPAGAPILDIVPDDDKLIVEARLDPLDVESVHVGMPAEITLSAYNRRKVPTLGGRVILVSADRIDDPKVDLPYYLIRAEVDRGQLEGLDEVKLLPGMPAEMMIETGSRTALRYTFDPLINSMNRAFREE